MEMKYLNSILFIIHLTTFATKLTYYNKKLSWINATQYCRENGLIMASNQVEIKIWLQNNSIQYGINETWFGMYEELTDWTYIRGCFDVRTNSAIKPPVKGVDSFLCQRLCKDEIYFGVKNNIYVCLKNVNIFAKCNCNRSDCMVVFEHKLQDFDSKNYGQKDKLCIVAKECDMGILVREYAQCSKTYRNTCDNGQQIPNDKAENQQEGALACHFNGSFLKWFNNNDCLSDGFPEHWTSGKRKVQNVFLHAYDEIDLRRLLKCYIIDRTGDIHKRKTTKCTTERRTFLCRPENSDDLITRGLPFFDSQQEKSFTASVVIGTVIAVVVVSGMIIGSVIFIKRRSKLNKRRCFRDKIFQLFSKSNNTTRVRENLQAHSQMGQNRTNNIFPSYTDGGQTNMPSNYSLAKPIETANETVNYRFAQPLTDPENNYAYNSKYDHLNNALKHTNESDYSTSANTSAVNNDKVETYYHLSSIERKADLLEVSNSNYEHLPTNTGSDPTYDVSGRMRRMIHDDSDKYDHLPKSIKNDTNNDYQSTRFNQSGDTTENYDNF